MHAYLADDRLHAVENPPQGDCLGNNLGDFDVGVCECVGDTRRVVNEPAVTE